MYCTTSTFEGSEPKKQAFSFSERPRRGRGAQCLFDGRAQRRPLVGAHRYRLDPIDDPSTIIYSSGDRSGQISLLAPTPRTGHENNFHGKCNARCADPRLTPVAETSWKNSQPSLRRFEPPCMLPSHTRACMTSSTVVSTGP